MANYCSNCIAFYGNDLNKLELLRKLMDGECKYIRDFVMKCGYIEVEALEFTDGSPGFCLAKCQTCFGYNVSNANYNLNEVNI